MTGAEMTSCRSAGARWLAYAAVTLVTLAGLFAMHGLAMTMPVATTMSSSTVASSPSASITASPMAGVHGGCDAEHDGCLATLRGQPHPVSPATITLTYAVADPASLFGHLTRAGLLRPEPPPPRPCLTELCISRT